eukprot:gene14449-19986_t
MQHRHRARPAADRANAPRAHACRSGAGQALVMRRGAWRRRGAGLRAAAWDKEADETRKAGARVYAIDRPGV